MAGNPFDQQANPFDDPAEAPAVAAPENPFSDPPPWRPEPDMTAAREHFKGVLAENRKARAENPAAKEADSFLEDLSAGWQMSTTGLMVNGRMPDTVLPEHAGIASNIVSGIGQLAGDVPAMVAGFFGGAAVGTAVAPVAGTALGAAGGSFAAPQALRKILIDHYERGDIQDANEFVHRAMGTLWEAAKGTAIGVATAGSGKLVGPIAEKLGGQLVSRVAVPTAEIATMTTASAALEGHLPDAKDFTVAAGVVSVLHGITRVGGGSARIAGKMREIYAKTGVRPEQIAEDVKVDPVTRQELLIDNGELPKAYGGKGANAEPSINPEALPKAEQAAPKEPLAISEAQAKIRSQIGEMPKDTKGVLEKTKEYVTDQAYKDWVDRFDPILKAQEVLSKGKELALDENPYTLSRMVSDAKAKVKHIVEGGTLDYKTLAKNGKGLKEILDPHKGDLASLNDYLVSSRVLELQKRGIEHGFDGEAAKVVVKEGRAKFDAAAKELTDFQNRNLEYLRDSGVLSESSFKAIQEANKNYVPFARIFEEAQSAGGKGKSSSLKRIKGSDKKIQNPILSILENTETLMKAAEKNRAVGSFISLAEKNEGIGRLAEGALIEKVPGRTKGIEITDAEVAKFMAENGIEGDATGFTVFRGARRDLGPNDFEVFRNGKREIYTTTPELAEAFQALGGDTTSMHFLLRAARAVTTVKKIGITLTPDFIIRNVFRDQLTQGTFSKGGATPFVDTFKAIGDLVGKNETYYNWLKSGGAGGSFLELNEAYLKNDVFKLGKETGFLEQTWNRVAHPVDSLMAAKAIVEKAGSVLENATRLAEFKRVSEGKSSGAKVFEGGFSAREVTIDFQRMGAKMSALNSITAFLNVSVQGLDRTARAVKENPTGVIGKAGAYITVPSVLLWWANKDDERVKAIPRWEKDTHWIIPTDSWVEATNEDHAELVPEYLKREKNGKLEINKGVIYRLPKPQELGILFGSLPERVLEKFFTDNPRAMKEFEKTMAGMITPNFMPDAAQPIVEQYFNKSLFTGHQLVPGHLEKVAPAYRYTEYTSETAKQLGKLTSYVPGIGSTSTAAPAVLDNYIRSYGGALGQYALQLADQGLRKAGVTNRAPRPDWTLKDVPAVKAFVVRYPQANAQQIVDFKERFDRVQEKKNTLTLLSKKIGMEEEWKSYFEGMHGDEFVQLDGVKNALDTARQVIQAINDNPDISPKEKRQLIDGQYHMMIQATEMANKFADQMEKEMRASESEFKRRVPPSKGALLGP